MLEKGYLPRDPLELFTNIYHDGRIISLDSLIDILGCAVRNADLRTKFTEEGHILRTMLDHNLISREDSGISTKTRWMGCEFVGKMITIQLVPCQWCPCLYAKQTHEACFG